jgi:tRNA-dihydrouridine synthase A
MFGDRTLPPTRAEVVDCMSLYLEREVHDGAAPRQVVRHMHGLYHGLQGARRWRRLLGDAASLDAAGAGILQLALSEVERPLREAA